MTLFKCKERGLALLETAIFLPLLLLLVFATIEFGSYYSVRINLENAARRAIDYAMRKPLYAADIGAIKTEAKEELAGVFGYDENDLTVASSEITLGDGSKGVEVTVSYRFSTLVKYPGLPRSMVLTRILSARLMSES